MIKTHYSFALSFVISFVFLFGISNAQSNSYDSLSKAVNTFQPAKKFELADTIYLKNIEQLNKLFFEVGESDSMRNYALKGLMFVKKQKAAATEETMLESLSNFEMVFNRQAGISYFDKGDYTNQLKYFQQFLVCAQNINSIKDIATAYVYIATCHRELEDLEKSFDYAKQAVQILKGDSFPSILGSAYALSSNYYIEEKINNDSALYYRKQAYLLFKKANNPMLLTSATFDMIDFFHSIRQTDSCKKYLAEIEPVIQELENPEQTMVFNTSEGKVANAIKMLRKARAIADKTDELNDNSQINRVLALALAADRKIAVAYNVMDSAFDEYSEDLNTEKVRSLTQAQMNFEFEKERTIAAIEIKRQKQQHYFLIAIASVLLVFAGFVFQRYRERHRSSLILAEKNKTIEKAYRELKETQHNLVETEKQREAQSIRVRIARDIHDEIGSGLTKITLLSDVAKKKSNQEEVAEALSKITTYSKGVSSSLSEIVWAINPGHDNIASLINYMKSTANNLLEDSGVNYSLHFPDTEISSSIHPEIKRNIFLVMKEAINNSLKYANAKNITVTFTLNKSNFKLIVADDGNGFDVTDFNKIIRNGNGLINMQQRMFQHQNKLTIISTPGHGCKIVAEGKQI